MSALRFITRMACLGPWGSDVDELVAFWRLEARPSHEKRVIPAVPGFIESQFNPLVYQCVKWCLSQTTASGGRQVAIVLGSLMGDTTTADLASQNLIRGAVHNPLLFYQSVPTSILGFVSRELGITGPMWCVSDSGTLASDLLEAADILLGDEDIDRVVVVGVELAHNPRSRLVFERLYKARGWVQLPLEDVAVGVVIEKRRLDRSGSPAVVLEKVLRLQQESGAGRGTVQFGEDVRLVFAEDVPIDPSRSSPGAEARRFCSTSHLGNWGSIKGLVDFCLAVECLKREELPARAAVQERSYDGQAAVLVIRAERVS